MTVICIVGSSKVDPEKVRPLVKWILFDFYHRGDLIISGGAKGVDKTVKEECDRQFIFCNEYHPVAHNQAAYLQRNRRMATAANCIFVIAVKGQGCYHHGSMASQTHDRTGGCYTARVAQEASTKCLIIIDPDTGSWTEPDWTAWRGVRDESIEHFQQRVLQRPTSMVREPPPGTTTSYVRIERTPDGINNIRYYSDPGYTIPI